MIFIIGTLPPTIRLLAMGGVPWTKAFGIMFLVSFFVVEIMVGFAGKDLGQSPFPTSSQDEDNNPEADEYAYLNSFDFAAVHLPVCRFLLLKRLCQSLYEEYSYS